MQTRLRLPPTRNLQGRIAYSSGLTYSSADRDDGHAPYMPCAVVPALPWRDCSADTAPRVFEAGEAWSSGDCIGVVPVGSRILELLRDAHAKQPSSDVSSLFAAVRGLARFCVRSEGLAMLGFFDTPVGMVTSTVDARSDGSVRPGLHVDSYDGIEVGNRCARRNRLCVNLGFETRYFLFIDATFDSLSAQVAGDAALTPLEVTARFLAQNPERRVIRLSIAPGEAYIAPTENIIHDATSLGKSKADVTFTLLGHFST
jgi:hypothetical protein